MHKLKFQVPDGDVEVAYEMPTPAIYDLWYDQKERSPSAANTMLVKACVRSHTGVQLDDLFSQYPGFKHAIAVAILRQAGGKYQIIEGEAEPS